MNSTGNDGNCSRSSNVPMPDSASAKVGGSGQEWRILGIQNFDAGRWTAALECFDRLDVGASKDTTVLNYRARGYEALGRHDEALRCIEQGIAIDGRNAADHRNRGVALRKLGRFKDALVAFDMALAIQPAYVDVLAKRAGLLCQLERRDEALECVADAFARQPNDIWVLNTRGMILDALGRYDEAMADFERMAVLSPEHPDAINNRGMIYARTGRFQEALDCYERSVALKHDDATLYNLAMVRLALGDWHRGLREFEARWKVAPLEATRFHSLTRLWTGREDLTGKTILLHHEQGYGDTLQFARYASLVAARGARVVLAVPEGLRSLMETLPGKPAIVSEGDPIPAHDYYCPLMSMPLAFGTTPETIPGDVPYLHADRDRARYWAMRLGPKTRARIGLVWCGRQYPPINYPRDMTLESLRPLFSLDAEFVSLQREMSAADRLVYDALPQLGRQGEELVDFADTAALIENLDVVIAVDTAVVHLTGAMGKPVWLMNRYASCWRWLQTRPDSPWYPNLKMFRQSSLGDWAGVVERVCLAAHRLVNSPPRGHARRKLAPKAASILKDALHSHQQGHIDAAMAGYREVLAAEPRNGGALHLLGVGLAQQERWDDAIRYLSASIEIYPDDPGTHSNLGNAYRGRGQPDAALACYAKAIALRSSFPDAYHNRGVVLRDLGRFEEALASLDKAIELYPQYAEAHCNRGAVLNDLHRHTDALASYSHALTILPNYAEAQWNKALWHLLHGEYGDGWRLHESRWEVKGLGMAQRVPSQRPWDGRQSIAGKTILLHTEQGFGDAIQFCRYATRARETGARVVLEAPESLHTLFRSMKDVDVVISRGDSVPPFDVHCPLMSLPLAFNTTLDTVPAEVPYLHGDPTLRARWAERLGPRRGTRIGVAWTGGSSYRNDAARSMALASLMPLLSCEADFICLQKEIRPSDAEVLANLPMVRTFAPELTSFAETAALIAELDLVVSVDTAVAHLSGALGMPVWIMLPYVPDWRWMLERSTSPWYPTARLYRQRRRDDWGEVVRAVLTDMLAFLKSGTFTSCIRTDCKMLEDALALHHEGKIDAAVEGYRRVLRFDPRNAAAVHCLGTGLAQLEQYDEAIRCLLLAVELLPHDAGVHSNLGNAYLGQKRYELALECYDKAVHLNPSFPDPHHNRGVALRELRRYEDALESTDEAIRLNPSYAEAHSNRGNVLSQLDRRNESLASYRLALACRPEWPEAHCNLGAELAGLGRFGEASVCYERALELQPGYAEALWNKSLLLLQHSELKEGWRIYESRWSVKTLGLNKRFPFQPPWDGAVSLQGKTILIHAEQGYGDTVQFCRYAPLLAARGAHVLLEAPASLWPLLRSLDGVKQLVAQNGPAPAFDVHCPMLSLPLAMETDFHSLPAAVPYLNAEASTRKRWADRLGRRKSLRVGIAWAGKPTHSNDRNRSIALAELRPLLDCPAEFISLQKEIRAVDAAAAEILPTLRHVGELLTDFGETAALISELDLVVTVDTSVAHLAGAMGKPVWIMLPHVPDWRWMLERDDSPWYPTARLFRQPRPGDWASVIRGIAREFAGFKAVTAKRKAMPRLGSSPHEKVSES